MQHSTLIDKVRQQIFGRRTDAEQMLAALIAIPSISGQEGAVQQKLCDTFDRLVGTCELIPMPESLRADPAFASGINVPFAGRPQTRHLWKGTGAGRSLILAAHVDVVGPGDWEDAFTPRLQGDRLYGRGAVDDKSAIVSVFLALQSLQAAGIRPAGDVQVHLTNEEEVGMAGALAFVRAGFRADGVLVCEPTGHHLRVAHRGCLQFTIEVAGKQAHLGRKRYGVNAIEKAAKIIDALVRYEDRLIEEGRGYPMFESFEYPRPGQRRNHQGRRLLLHRARQGHPRGGSGVPPAQEHERGRTGTSRCRARNR
ncbi:MAG: M20/M25/M40 family metallo-hydrolase [Kiritimatiellae bacterium]|nr:M20/M25/M40 family metallo-hydrolase [Kiritimatiellia bacterium]